MTPSDSDEPGPATRARTPRDRAGPDADDAGLDLARSSPGRWRDPAAAARRRPTSGAEPAPAPRSTRRPRAAHPDDRDPQLLGATLDRLVAERGWEDRRRGWAA